MNGERGKLNNGGTLEAFPVARFPEPHGVRIIETVRIPYGITRQEVPGWKVKIPVVKERVYRFPRLTGSCSPAGLSFPLLEQDRARTFERVNGAEVFRAFARAAHGRVRHSVRWKLARRRVSAAYVSFVKGFTPFSPSTWPAVMKSFRLALARNRRKLAARSGSSDRTYKFSKHWLTVDGKTQRRVTQDPRGYFQLIRQYHESIRQAERVRASYRSIQDDWRFLPDEGDWEDFTLEDANPDAGDFTQICESDWDIRPARAESAYIVDEYHFSPKYLAGVGDWVNVSLMDREPLRELLRGIKRPGFILLFLRRVLSVIYRVQTCRRAGPPVRRPRFRIPRPPGLLPLPPSAPLAPPA